MYVHTSFVLIKPPIPYTTSSPCERLRVLRPVEILLTYGEEEDTHLTSSPCKRLRILNPAKNLLHERARPRRPPCNVLKNVFCLKEN